MILDLGQVKTLDSLALLTLLACREAAALRGARIKLCALRPRARSVLLGARFHRLFEIFNTTEEARASFS